MSERDFKKPGASMKKKEWQNLNERLATRGMELEGSGEWKKAAECWLSLADLREEEADSPLRVRAKECLSRVRGAKKPGKKVAK